MTFRRTYVVGSAIEYPTKDPDMSSYILTITSTESTPDPEPRVISLEGPEIEEVFETLSSATRRSILEQLYEDPATPSELSTVTSTSLQNVHYHLEKLESVDLVESIGTRYSEKGREMNVYGPTTDPLILVDTEATRSSVVDSLHSIVGALSVLAIASILLQWVSRLLRPSSTPGIAETASRDAAVTTEATGQTSTLLTQLNGILLEPGTILFVGGLVGLVGYLIFKRVSR